MPNRSRSVGVAIAIAVAACHTVPPPKPAAPAPGPATATPGPRAAPASQPIAAEPPPPPALPAIPSTPAPAPDGLVATAATPAPALLWPGLVSYLDAVEPGFAAQVSFEALVAEAAKEGLDLRGIDLGRPLRALALDPRRYPTPFVIVAAVADPKALAAQTAAHGLRYQTRNGWAAIGTFDALSAAGGYALTTLADAPVPPTPELDVDVGYLMRTYGQMIQLALAAGLADTPADQRAFLEPMMDGLVERLAQIDHVRLSIDIHADRASAVLRIEPLPGTGLAAFIAAQTPATFAHVEELAGSPMLLGGKLDYGNLIADFGTVMEPMMRKFYGDATPDVMASFRKWAAVKPGELGGAMQVGSKPGTFTVAMLMDVADPALLVSAWKDQSAAQVKASGALFTAKAGSTTYRKIKLSTLTVTPNPSAPAADREVVAPFGGTSVQAVGIVGKTAVMGFGTDGVKVAKALVDRVKAPAGSALVSRGLTAALELARRRRESMIVTFDLPAFSAFTRATAGAPAPSAPPVASGFEPATLGIGSDAGALALRFTLPVAQVQALRRTMAMAAPPSAAGADADAAIDQIEALTNRLCACKDQACADQVMKDVAAVPEPHGQPTDAQMQRAMGLAKRIQDCEAKLPKP